MIPRAEEVESDTTNLENAEPVKGPSGTCCDEESNGSINRPRDMPTAGPSDSPRDEIVSASLGEVVDVADIEQAHKSVALSEQVRSALQLASLVKAEPWFSHSCLKTTRESRNGSCLAHVLARCV